MLRRWDGSVPIRVLYPRQRREPLFKLPNHVLDLFQIDFNIPFHLRWFKGLRECCIKVSRKARAHVFFRQPCVSGLSL